MERRETLVRITGAPVARLAVEPVSGNGRRQPTHDGGRRAFRRSIAGFALDRCRLSSLIDPVRQRRAAHFGNVGCSLLLISRGRPGPGFCPIPGASVRNGEGPHIHVSQLLAGGRSTSGRSPDAARVRGCEPRPRAPHRRRPGIAGRPPPNLGPHLRPDLRSAPPPRRL